MEQNNQNLHNPEYKWDLSKLRQLAQIVERNEKEHKSEKDLCQMNCQN